MNSTNLTYHLAAEGTGARLDKYVSEKCPELSRTRAQKLIEDGHIRVNGQPAKSSLKLQAGDEIDIAIPPPTPSPLVPEAIPLKILYEDQDLLVVDKPAGLTVHPAPGHYSHTLVNAILAHVPDIETGETERPGIVHRLDKDTSGLIIVAKNRTAHMKLADQFKNRTVTKVYLTLVKGHLAPSRALSRRLSAATRADRKRMAVVARGREARTEYKVITLYRRLYPAGDQARRRGGPTRSGSTWRPSASRWWGMPPMVPDRSTLSRQFLHACKLGFKLPSTGEYREFESALPTGPGPGPRGNILCLP